MSSLIPLFVAIAAVLGNAATLLKLLQHIRTPQGKAHPVAAGIPVPGNSIPAAAQMLSGVAAQESAFEQWWQDYGHAGLGMLNDHGSSRRAWNAALEWLSAQGAQQPPAAPAQPDGA